ncbi:hypothetical protein [Mesobacillus subterraneus]|uniref:DUF7878 domain-containing protein n=1 Tax=Mesobacillus subterraneus TaxID=285983 RepID=A0A0D6ZBX6_9BACI|nr:hypothetical protein [Mesobacillus subterraneus]KIY22561.1 hypothetical protein UB32_07780 [Mesobacillus subterraneus]
MFFNEQYILLLELGIALKKWLQKIKLNDIESFEYITMDDDEGPLLEFIYTNNGWGIYSRWQEFEFQKSIPIEILIEAIEYFLSDLQEQLLSAYNLRLTDYL